jgi:hypothetical protein
LARGVTRHRPILADAAGRPWRAPEKVIDALRESEARGLFDQILHKNDSVTLAYGVLSCVRSVLTSEINADVVQLLTPLFGGCRATVRSDKLIHAA